MSYLGADSVDKMFLGSTKIGKAYLGNDLVYTKPAALPYDSKVEYLESNGSQYIDLGIQILDNDIIEVDAMFLAKSGDNMMFGVSGGSGEGSIWLEYYSNQTYYVRFGSSSSVSKKVSSVTSSRKTFTLKKSNFSVNGSKLATPNYSSMPSGNLYLFARNSSTKYNFIGRIYRFKVNRGGSYIVDLEPVRISQVGYMYNNIDNTMRGNDGSGSFGIGNDIS